MTIRVFEAFAGVGSQRMALRNLGIDHEVVAIAEIDKFAIKSYEAIHGETNNLGDISQIETTDIPDHDLFTYSFPCQDISVAGKGLGLDEGSDTRSGLLWECQKVIYGKRPKYLLLENVKNLVGKKHKHNFDKWLEWLEKQGYTNYYKILNAKDYGIPQNRERVFVVSILGHHEPYEFPESIELELRLKDVLEDEVDEKFYLDNEKANKLISTVASKHEINEPTPTDGGLKKPKPREVANTITARYDAGVSNQQSMGTMVIEPNNKKDSDSLAVGFIPRTNGTQHQSNTVYRIDKESPSVSATDYKNPIKVLLDNDTTDNEPKAERIGGIFDKDGTKHQAGAVWDKEQLSPTLDTMQGGWRQPSVVVDKDGIDTELMVQIQEKMMLTDDECEYGVLKQELFDKFGASRVCTRCKSQILYSDLPNYDYLCFECDENLYEFETENAHFLIGSTQKNAGITDGDYTTTLTSAMGSGGGHVPMHNMTPNLRIRKLSPKETWRLMGFSDDDFHKAEAVNSNSQLYKQAGNSIVVDVLEGIFKQLLEEK